MLNKLYELNPFFEISVNNITVLCNLDNAFAFRCSDIMNMRQVSSKKFTA